MTDSSESEDIQHATSHCRQIGSLKQQHQQQQQKLQFNLHEGSASDQRGSNYTSNMQTSFRSVMMTDHCELPGSSFSSFNNDYDERNIDADNVAILGGTDPKETHHEPMSTARQCCFVGSIALCVFAVVGFLWLVPCGEHGTCPAVVDRIKTHNWLNNYTKIELKGGVNIVGGLRSWENNLIFLYRGDTFFPEYDDSNMKRNGIISLIGSSGAVAWYDEMVDEPVAIDCTLLDVDRNGRTDCLVIDEYGEIGAINPLSGQWHWRFKEHSPHKLDTVDFPIILPDLDGDGVLDILMVSSATLEQRTKAYVNKGDVPVADSHESQASRNLLRILSGRSGKPIGYGFQIRDCDMLRKLQLENQLVTFNCLRNNTELQRYKTLAELFALITNKPNGSQKLAPASEISQYRHHTDYSQYSQHSQYSERSKDSEAQRNIYSLSGRELVVENRGRCPDDCSVTMVLRETRDGRTNVLRNFTNSGMYGMVPAQWHFKNTQMSGFVMKFWNWNNLNNATNAPTPTPTPTASAAAPAPAPVAASSGGIPSAAVASSSVTTTTTTTTRTTRTTTSGSITPSGVTASPSEPYHGNYASKKSKSNQVTKENFAKTTKQNQIPPAQSKKAHHKREFDHDFPPNEFNAFDHLIVRRDAYALVSDGADRSRFERASLEPDSNMTKKPTTINGRNLLNNYKMQMITETVILVLFIGADTRIENTSQSNIVQFCRKERSELICQPDLTNQENSMLIVDLDQDDSQELVSYFSTFVQTSDDPDDWKLVTYVRLLRLQSELPAFYGDDKRN